MSAGPRSAAAAGRFLALGAGETATFAVTGTTGRAGRVVMALGGAHSVTPDPELRDDLASRLTLVTR